MNVCRHVAEVQNMGHEAVMSGKQQWINKDNSSDGMLVYQSLEHTRGCPFRHENMLCGRKTQKSDRYVQTEAWLTMQAACFCTEKNSGIGISSNDGERSLRRWKATIRSIAIAVSHHLLIICASGSLSVLPASTCRGQARRAAYDRWGEMGTPAIFYLLDWSLRYPEHWSFERPLSTILSHH